MCDSRNPARQCVLARKRTNVPYADIEDKKVWTRDNKDRVNASARARWKYRRSTPEKVAHYQEIKRAYYERTKEARKQYRAKWRRANWRKLLGYSLKRKFGLSLEQFDLMLKAQGNRCFVCKSDFSKENLPNVDHCHKTLTVRGLLCRSCNYAEGFLKTPDNARRLYEYMLKNDLFYQAEN